MNDPLAQLEQLLTDAARRRRAAGTVPARGRARRVLIICAAALAVAGTATAAVIRLTAKPSKPLAGSVDSARRYQVSLIPDLRAGTAGWCGSLRLGEHGRTTAAGLGCGPARAAGDHMIVGGGIGGGGDNTTSVSYVVVTADVPAVRFGRTTVGTRADPSLPNGWRYAVFIDRADPEPPAPRPLDAHGRPVAMTLSADNSTRAARSRAVTSARPARHCVIGTAPGFIAGYRRVALGRPRIPQNTEGPVFASCATTIFHTHDRRGGLTVAILVNAHNPKAPAAPLPRAPDLSAERLGPAWLVVYGQPAARRARLLNRLAARL